MTYTIQRGGGDPEPFTGPILRAISFTSSHNRRYELHDEQGRSIDVIDVGPMKLRDALEDRGFRLFGRLVEDEKTMREWGYSFALERFERQLGFRAQILTGPTHAPNGGISAHAQYVTIIPGCAEGSPMDSMARGMGLTYATSDAPAVRFAAPFVRALVPVDVPAGKPCGPMASGAFAYSADPRWEALTNGQGPIPLLDRWESDEEYEALSS